jgi:hypothetical protein
VTTTVINKRSPGFKPNANQRYIGRGSLWGNPFTHLPLSRAKAQFHVETEEESMLRYEAWLREKLAKDPQLRQKLLDLDGQELVCYCKPRPCHGDILIKLIEEIKQGGGDQCSSVGLGHGRSPENNNRQTQPFVGAHDATLFVGV